MLLEHVGVNVRRRVVARSLALRAMHLNRIACHVDFTRVGGRLEGLIESARH